MALDDTCGGGGGGNPFGGAGPHIMGSLIGTEIAHAVRETLEAEAVAGIACPNCLRMTVAAHAIADMIFHSGFTQAQIDNVVTAAKALADNRKEYGL